jgi:hypothetical protein
MKKIFILLLPLYLSACVPSPEVDMNLHDLNGNFYHLSGSENNLDLVKLSVVDSTKRLYSYETVSTEEGHGLVLVDTATNKFYIVENVGFSAVLSSVLSLKHSNKVSNGNDTIQIIPTIVK